MTATLGKRGDGRLVISIAHNREAFFSCFFLFFFFYRRWRRDVGPWRWSSINAVMRSPDSRRSFRMMAGSVAHANREPPPHTYGTKSCSEIRANHPLSQMSMQTHAAVWRTDVWVHVAGLWVRKTTLLAEWKSNNSYNWCCFHKVNRGMAHNWFQ